MNPDFKSLYSWREVFKDKWIQCLPVELVTFIDFSAGTFCGSRPICSFWSSSISWNQDTWMYLAKWAHVLLEARKKSVNVMPPFVKRLKSTVAQTTALWRLCGSSATKDESMAVTAGSCLPLIFAWPEQNFGEGFWPDSKRNCDKACFPQSIKINSNYQRYFLLEFWQMDFERADRKTNEK